MPRREYKIKITDDNEVTPEEVLLDSSSSYSDFEKPISNFVFEGMRLLILASFALVLFFVFKLDVLGYKYFSGLALQNRSINFSIPPPRGIIFDKTGKALVKNLPRFDLLIITREAKESLPDFNKSLPRAANILGIPLEDFKKSISENLKSNSVFFAMTDLSKDQVLALKYLDPKGFYIISNVKRSYTDGHQLSQVIGYISKVNKNDLNKDDYYTNSDNIGRLGIEFQYEKDLRGEHGQIYFNKGERDENQSNINPKIGNSVVLNIDHDLQKKLYSEMYKILAEFNLSRGTAIIQNPQNGQILAMLSFPTFDNNDFVSGLSEANFKKIFESKSKPLFNRTISGLYNPGSTIKPFIALSILEEKIFSSQDTIQDCISLTIPNPNKKDSPYVFKNWRQDYGLFNLRRAISHSCNIYFFIGGGGFGNVSGLGIGRIAKYLNLALADSRLGIDIPGEEKGFIPTPEWKLKTKGENWYQGDTYNVSIGQGDLLTTPLWLNSYISAIANGGIIYEPQVASQILDNKMNVIKKFEPRIIKKLPFKDETIREVRDNLQETVISGTARLLQNLPVRAGAKTGTAEVIKGRSINSVFTAFAPFDDPEIVITVLIEGSTSNQNLAIIIANNILKWYFEKFSSSLPSPVYSVTNSPTPRYPH